MLTLKKRSRWGLRLAIILSLVLVLIGGYVGLMASLPLPNPKLEQTVFSQKVPTDQTVNINWPDAKQLAIGAADYGVVASRGGETQLPIASVAKIVTALAVLQKQPLEAGQTGPIITLTSADVASYNYFAARGGSVVRVNTGEKLSQYQAMQGMLVPSGNNLAVSLATWAFGSEAAYVDYANNMLGQIGVKNTTIADASGFSPNTKSTASDLVLIGEAAIKNPVIAEIVSQSEVTLPIVGRLVSTNKVLGQAGISGIKTGHTPQAGGCLLFSAPYEVGGKKLTLVGAIVGASSSTTAQASAPGVIDEAKQGFAEVKALSAGSEIAKIEVPWAQPEPVIAKQDLSQVTWKGGEPLELKVSGLQAKSEAGEVGQATFGDSTTPLVLEHSLPAPNLWWRITHPGELLSAWFAR